MLASVVIRTYNEEKYLSELLLSLHRQNCDLVELEIIIVDSGSTDSTLTIAKEFSCRITSIKKGDFTFGKALNIGCELAKGELLVFISGHCIPKDETWLDELCRPLIENNISYVYGRQEGRDTTKFSEYMHFNKWFPDYSKIPQSGYFCNNANAALCRDIWMQYKFNEDLTGLEDMHLAKELTNAGYDIGYIYTASVFHIHDEKWKQVSTRYEREAYALQKIMPDVHFKLLDCIKYFVSGVMSDFFIAKEDGEFLKFWREILLFRFHQNMGTYIGNHTHRKISNHRKHNYFYPKDIDKDNY